MYGMRDLLAHMIYINGRDKVEPMAEHTIDKVVLAALGLCYYHGHDINYNYVMQKSLYGAKSWKMTPKSWIGYKRVKLEEGYRIKELEEDRSLNNYLSQLIRLNNEDSYHIPRLLISTDSYQKDADLIEEITERNDWLERYPYWTKKEIITMFGENKNNNISIDSRIPLTLSEYKIMEKYMKVYNGKFNHEESFSLAELNGLHRIPAHIIKSVEENGFYLKKEEH